MGPTDIQRTMLALAFFADSDVADPFAGDYATALRAYNTIKGHLPKLNAKPGYNWQVVWGPAVFTFSRPSDKEVRRTDNQLYVVRNGSSGEYAVAIAGTDAASLADWYFEDMDVKKTEAWPYAKGVTPTPLISCATFNGLNALLGAAPPELPPGTLGEPIPGAGEQLLTFLQSIPKNQPITVSTTGHSLGGALSPALALALVDTQAQWDPTRAATVLPFAFAGATPGDAAFTAYFQSRFPNGMQRIWNAIDIVPHAWDVAHLREVPTIYGIPPVQLIQGAIVRLISEVGSIGYAPLDDLGPTFIGERHHKGTPRHLLEFMDIAVHQHITAYLDWAGIQDWFKKPKL